MSNDELERGVTRRQAIAGLAGATGAAAIGLSATGCASSSSGGSSGGSASGSGAPQPGGATWSTSPDGRTMPVVFVPHGGGPWPWMSEPFGSAAELGALRRYLESIRALPGGPPRALLVVSAHWEEVVPTVMTGARPPMLYDYYGFPPETYQVQWPAPGQPALAGRVRDLLGAAGLRSGSDEARGFDHGTFVPMALTYPDASVPTVQLSLQRGLDPAAHLAIGRALAPLRREGVLIVGSGMTYHNLRAFGPRAAPVAAEFDTWLRTSTTADPGARDAALPAWAQAPSARQAHPREEHLLPLMVCAGAAGSDRGVVAYQGSILGLALSGYQFG